jgi:mono/diheme cytochrome c family protein
MENRQSSKQGLFTNYAHSLSVQKEQFLGHFSTLCLGKIHVSSCPLMENFRRIIILAPLCLATALFAQTPNPPSPPATAPADVNPPPVVRPSRVIPSPSGPLQPGSPTVVNAGVPISTVTVPVTNIPKEPTLVFDSETKTYDAKPAEASAPFVFNLTNVWTNEIIIERCQTSCGCTVAQLPSQPWHIQAGTNGQIKVTVTLAGKPPGLITKTVTVYTSVGMRMLTVKVNNPPPPAQAAMSEEQRKKNQEQAMKDRQAVFHTVGTEDCAKCHVHNGDGKMGKELFAADCGICHDSPHKATGVPDLKAIAAVKQTTFDYWRDWIKDGGKVGSMMPAFGQEHGGPLTEPQINSVAAYLAATYSKGVVAPAAVTNAALIRPQTP